MRCYPLEGDEIRVEMSASTVEVGTQQRFLSHVRPRERQFEEKETIQKQTAAIEAAIDGVAILDENGEYEYVNEAHASIYGYDDPGDLIGNSWRCLYGDAEVGRFEEQILPEVRETGSWQGEAIGERADGSSFPQMVSLSTVKSGGLVCVVRDVSDVKTGIDIDDTWLTRLNEMGQELMQAQRRATIADVALDTVGRLFEYDVACVRLLDDEENTLDIEAASDTATSLIESEPACDLEGTFAGQAYRQGETLVRTAENSGVLAATPVAASMHLPLGEFGVLTVASTEAASFTEVDVEGAKMLAASVEAALNRAERERQLREQTEDLQQQRNQLETVNQVNKLVHDLVGELFNASSREDIQQRVCDRLSESRLYKSAWIGELTVTGDGISVTAAAGLEEDSMQDVDELPVDVIGNGTVKEALSEGEVVDNRRYRVHDDGITDNPDDSMEATAAVPIQYDGRAFGVLVVNATHQDAFATVGTESLAILGDIIGFAINAVENRELLLSNKTVQLEFEVTDEDCLAVAITKDLGCYCRMQQTIQSSDGQYLSYVECEGVAGDEALDTIAAIDTVTHCRVISDQGNRCVVEVKRKGCGSEVMMEYGATMQRADAENGVGSLVIEAPQSVNVRQIVEAYEEYNPDSELVAKRELERPVKTAAEFRSSLEEQLTDRQTAAITAAYFSGYYEWPRESTGEEIAESMDISSATLHQHIRSAHKEFLTAFLENGTQSPTDPI
jgi:PAS domain S-box-containing protein